jgi:hypothetical protein
MDTWQNPRLRAARFSDSRKTNGVILPGKPNFDFGMIARHID